MPHEPPPSYAIFLGHIFFATIGGGVVRIAFRLSTQTDGICNGCRGSFFGLVIPKKNRILRPCERGQRRKRAKLSGGESPLENPR